MNSWDLFHLKMLLTLEPAHAWVEGVAEPGYKQTGHKGNDLLNEALLLYLFQSNICFLVFFLFSSLFFKWAVEADE